MKRSLLPALALLTACAGAPRPKPEAPAQTAKPPPPPPGPAALAPTPFEVAPLAAPAPMEVVTLADPEQPVVDLRLVFRAGAVDDPAGKEGLTALTTRLVVEGGTATRTPSQVLEALYPLAGVLHADTDKELTTFVARVHRDKVDAFLEVFAEVLGAPRFDPREFERLRSAALNTVRTRLRGENDEELGKVALDALLFEGHPYRHFNGGTVQGLTALTLEDARRHWASTFTRDRLVLGLAGPVDAKLEARVKAALEKLPATGTARAPLPKVPGFHGRTWILQRDTLSTAGSFGVAWPLRRGHPDFHAVALGLSYLGEHRQFHGRLFTELREKRGLNYGTYAYAEHFRQEGWSSMPMVNVARAAQDASVWLRPVEPQNAVFALRGVLRELRLLLEQPLPKEEFETAKGFLAGWTRAWEQTAQRRLGWAIDARLYGTQDHLAGLRDALATLTAEDVQAALRRHLRPEAFNFVFVTKDAAGLKSALVSAAPSPIQYPTPKPKDVLDADAEIGKEPLPLPPGRVEVLDAQAFMER